MAGPAATGSDLIVVRRGSGPLFCETYALTDRLRCLERTMVVAVTFMRVMQMATNQIVNVVAVRHAFVPTGRTVSVLMIVGFAVVVGCASARIDATY